MQTVSSIKSVTITRPSLVNGALTNYTFKISFSNSVVNGDQLVIENPKTNPIKYSNSTKCYGLSANLYYSLSCSQEASGQSLRVILSTRFLRSLQSSSSFSSSQASLLITDVWNPQSLQPTSSFTLT